MGLRDRIRGAVNRVMTGGGGPSSPRQPEAPRASPPPPSKPAPAPQGAAGTPDGEVKPWYLEGTDSEGVEGWDQTNPGVEPGKTNLRD